MARFQGYAPQASALLIVSGLGHGLALAYACLSPRMLEVPSGRAYLVVLIAASALLVGPLVRWPRDGGVASLVIGLKVGLAVLVFIPMWFPSPLKAVVLGVVVAETVFALPRPWDIAGSLAALALILGTQAKRRLWDVDVAAAGADEIATLAFVSALTGTLAGGYKDALIGLRRSLDEVERLKDGTQAIIMANVRFQERAQEAEDASSERERKRISREVHDVVGYTITNQAMAMEAALVLLDQDDQRERLRALLEDAKRQSREGLAEVRTALRALRSQRAPYSDFQNRLLHICRTFNRATGVEVVCEVLGQHVRLPVGLDMALYRIVQAGLTNSFLHGRARNVRVLVQGIEGVLHLSIQDDGAGSQAVQEGIGLAGMRERLTPFGGSLDYSSGEAGFTVKATAPLEPAESRGTATAPAAREGPA